jgi:hypothetical protein
VSSTNKKTAGEKDRKRLLVEAAGIEPASRDISMQASTSVVGNLNFAALALYRQSAQTASKELFLIPGIPRADPGRSGFDGRFSVLSGEEPQPGRLLLGRHAELRLGI